MYSITDEAIKFITEAMKTGKWNWQEEEKVYVGGKSRELSS